MPIPKSKIDEVMQELTIIMDAPYMEERERMLTLNAGLLKDLSKDVALPEEFRNSLIRLRAILSKKEENFQKDDEEKRTQAEAKIKEDKIAEDSSMAANSEVALSLGIAIKQSAERALITALERPPADREPAPIINVTLPKADSAVAPIKDGSSEKPTEKPTKEENLAFRVKTLIATPAFKIYADKQLSRATKAELERVAERMIDGSHFKNRTKPRVYDRNFGRKNKISPHRRAQIMAGVNPNR